MSITHKKFASITHKNSLSTLAKKTLSTFAKKVRDSIVKKFSLVRLGYDEVTHHPFFKQKEDKTTIQQMYLKSESGNTGPWDTWR